VSDAAVLEALGVRVAFRRLADRYSHAVEISCGGEWIPLLESIEGAADDDWPPSPPLQELHFESRADGTRLALLVGRAGRSHWSLSVEAAPDASRIVFDAACRLRDVPRRLGSHYQWLPASGAPALVAADVVNLIGGWRLRADTIDDLAPSLETTPSGVSLRPSLENADVLPHTARWRYAFVVLEDRPS
jgi:hypothetical protein